ncbi:CaiB/BaiF CoA-transferase family protein [Williamsia sp. DF01-3]|uniref:CaiB/BaiF CoA transferase family protein n=1 Tax=Williamsia sp. DF01-3 TaxID=2934157 RepID=UPI001FF1EB84|nr:CoA transferase [Williamsia sp. DF01-3]MCK0517344.1 CoA transferase [Williamsia sp. DF01-3]
MSQILNGIRVVELATWGFMPSAGVVLSDWGAEVIKVEHPAHGDPMRGLVTGGLLSLGGTSEANFMWEATSRGKRSIGLDLKQPAAREAFLKLIETADVFLTNYLPDVREKLGIDVDDLRSRNPRLVYARASGLGPDGDEKNSGGFDLAAYWARSGVAHATTPASLDYPLPMPGPAFGDLQGGQYAAGGVVGALFQRERTGEAPVVDVSLLAAGIWSMGPHISASSVYGMDMVPASDRTKPSNPLSSTYRTSDGRFVSLVMLESDRFWPGLVAALGRPELADDPRFVDAGARKDNNVECVRVLDNMFNELTLDAAARALGSQRGVWAVVATPKEAASDPQAQANGYVQYVELHGGQTVAVATSPVQFDQYTPAVTPGPELGESTEILLLELGVDWDDISAMKDKGAVS